MSIQHIPVLLSEVIHYIQPYSGGVYLDCTVGLGGHAAAILEASSPDGKIIGIDWDKKALTIARSNLNRFHDRVILVQDNFVNVDAILDAHGIALVDGILMDLGISALQLETPSRGFSFLHSGSLDMRMDVRIPYSAEHVINTKGKGELTDIFYRFGEERWARKIASAIVQEREKYPVTNTRQLAKIIERVVPKAQRKSRLHPATKIFQALRIYVNRELDNLKRGLQNAIAKLKPNGAICVISFHSLEDRIIKRTFRFLSQKCICPPEVPICVCNHKPSLQLLTKKPVVPQSEEIQQNPRARSAKLRAAIALP